MKILIDMNLTPDWAGVLKLQGLEAVHWSKVGDPKASDKTIMSWARERGYSLIYQCHSLVRLPLKTP